MIHRHFVPLIKRMRYDNRFDANPHTVLFWYFIHLHSTRQCVLASAPGTGVAFHHADLRFDPSKWCNVMFYHFIFSQRRNFASTLSDDHFQAETSDTGDQEEIAIAKSAHRILFVAGARECDEKLRSTGTRWGRHQRELRNVQSINWIDATRKCQSENAGIDSGMGVRISDVGKISGDQGNCVEHIFFDRLTFQLIYCVCVFAFCLAGHDDDSKDEGSHLSRAERGGRHVHVGHGAQLARWQVLPPLSRRIFVYRSQAPLPQLRPNILRPVFGEDVHAAQIRHRKRGASVRCVLHVVAKVVWQCDA